MKPQTNTFITWGKQLVKEETKSTNHRKELVNWTTGKMRREKRKVEHKIRNDPK